MIESKLKYYRISKEEFEKIKNVLGREPRGVEWALFSALWSEHCSYKSSRVHLKKFFNKSPRVVMSFGENAGVIDLGEGERVAFKMESHNHPSFIEPYEGAATGVGGILRDIFTMGARPVALADYLCFGEPQADRVPALVDGVVRGIGGYGNCVGVPTITGQTEFHSSYNKNNLVNALAVGLFAPGEPVVSSKAEGPGNKVVYVGAKTGKDGVHGASMASESFDDNSESKKPTIQKGDPFFEKLLIESCIEVMQAGLVVAIQDMGAAGLTSSSFEMAAKGGVGFRMDLDKVPLRDSSMVPEEILLSESQERMLLIAKPENIPALKKVFEKWNLDAEVVGEVTSNPEVELFWHGESICKMDPALLVDNAPLYNRPYQKWESKNRVPQVKHVESDVSSNADLLLDILRDQRGTSRNWIFNQYDQRVGANTAADCTESVGVIRLPAKERAMGLVLGCRPHLMRFDASVGAMDSIFYPSLELAAKGFLPLAATDCLNFGNPENSEIMSEFVATVESMSDACESLNVPVISGNVSFYNETLGQNITSTPATGLVGIKDDLAHLPKSYFQQNNNEIYRLSFNQIELNGLIAELRRKPVTGSGEINIEMTSKFVDLVRHMVLSKFVVSSRVIGKFGLAYALARMSTSDLGIEVGTQSDDISIGPLFGENLYEVLFEVSADKSFMFREMFDSLAKASPFQLRLLGHVRTGRFRIEDTIDLPLSDLKLAYENSWEVLFAGLS